MVGARHVDALALKALQAMLKHRPVDFFQHVEAHGDLEVGRDADEIAVQGGVVELAEREAVGNDRLAQGMAVREDVSGFQQLVMAESADGAALLVGAEHALAKPRWCRRCRTTAVTYCRRAVSAAGSLNSQAAGAPIWSSIATTKLRVSGWSSTMKTGHAAS